MYTLLKPLPIRAELLKRNLRVFTGQEFMRIFSVTTSVTKHLLETNTKDGFLLRLKRGVYALGTDKPTEEEIANAMYRPSYLSFEYALAYYNLLPEMSYAITSATTKPTRLFDVSGKVYSYRTIKKEAYTGYHIVKRENGYFYIAEKEKAIIDYLYFVPLRKAPLNDRLLDTIRHKSHKLKKGKMLTYAKLFANKELSHLINTLV